MASSETDRLLTDERDAALVELGISQVEREHVTSIALPPWFHGHRDWRRRGEAEVGDTRQPGAAEAPPSNRDNASTIVGVIGRGVDWDDPGSCREKIKNLLKLNHFRVSDFSVVVPIGLARV